MRRLFAEDDCKVVRERERERERKKKRERERENCRQLIGKQDAAVPPSSSSSGRVRETPVGRKRVNRREREYKTDGSRLGSELCRSFFRALERARKRARWDALTENWVCAHLQKMFKVSFGQFQSVLWWQSCAQYHDQDLEDILFQFESHLPIYLSHFTSERKVIASYIRTIETEILLRRFKLETWITATHWK